MHTSQKSTQTSQAFDVSAEPLLADREAIADLARRMLRWSEYHGIAFPRDIYNQLRILAGQ